MEKKPDTVRSMRRWSAKFSAEVQEKADALRSAGWTR